ncbi:MAG: phenylacetate--CoA ligase [Actinobacteria bacterium]|nr:phenylacetate--CoA ligase [Actinomycetota bacterium]
MNEIWNPEYETMTRKDLRTLQEKRLQMTLRWAHSSVPFYRQRWEESGINVRDIKTLDDVTRLPFTTKADFRRAYPYGMFAVPLERVIRIHTSSGSPSSPTVVGFTRGDLNTWAELCARAGTAGGARSHDVVQITFGYGLQTGALGWHAGLERLGATVIPTSTGATKRQLMIMRDYHTSVLAGSPFYGLHLCYVADELGIRPPDLNLRIALLGGEPWSEAIRREIQERLGVQARDTYGVSEVLGPGLSFECPAEDGLHVNEDHVLVEVVDPKSGVLLAEGEEGELVFTSLTKEAVPVIRYRTGDLAAITTQRCACGRTLVRHTRVQRRCDDMLKVRGVNVFPAQVENVLAAAMGVPPRFQILLETEAGLDQMEVLVPMDPALFTDDIRDFVDLRRELEERLADELAVRVRVRFVEPTVFTTVDELPARVVDKRRR